MHLLVGRLTSRDQLRALRCGQIAADHSNFLMSAKVGTEELVGLGIERRDREKLVLPCLDPFSSVGAVRIFQHRAGETELIHPSITDARRNRLAFLPRWIGRYDRRDGKLLLRPWLINATALASRLDVISTNK